MKKQIVFEFPLEEIIEKVAKESTERILKKLEESLIIDAPRPQEITRKQTAIYLGISPPTVDKYTYEGLLTKHGSGKRARYLLHELDAAKPLIRDSLYTKDRIKTK